MSKPKITLIRFSLDRGHTDPERTAPVMRLPRRKTDKHGRPLPGTGQRDWIPTGWQQTFDRPVNRHFRRSLTPKTGD